MPLKRGTTQYLSSYLPNHVVGWVSISNWLTDLNLLKPDCVWKENGIVTMSSA